MEVVTDMTIEYTERGETKSISTRPGETVVIEAGLSTDHLTWIMSSVEEPEYDITNCVLVYEMRNARIVPFNENVE
jgi:hypothetical protein